MRVVLLFFGRGDLFRRTLSVHSLPSLYDESGLARLFALGERPAVSEPYGVREPGGISLRLQNPKSHALSEIGTNELRFMTKPDIVIQSGDTPVMVIDTKWKQLAAIDDSKRGVSQSDVYQMMAYAQIYRVKHLMLL